MKIAQIAPLIERLPPKTYGGTERVVHALIEELVKRGHEVTLFASGDSQTHANLLSVYPMGLREAKMDDLYGPNGWTMLNIGIAYSLQQEFDVIHDHVNPFSLTTAQFSRTPVVMTLHGSLEESRSTVELFRTFKRPYLVSISYTQRQPAPDLHYIGNVYNGLPMASYPFSDRPENYLLYVGRISPNKGVHLAIEVAKQLGLPLVIAAKLDKPVNIRYFHEYIKPKLSDKIRWIGEVDEQTRNQLYSKALCFLHPVTWREPFGLTLIEAMACGCPVVAFTQGSIPEIIQHGKTGFIVDTHAQMVKSIKKIATIDRAYCRQYALSNFSAEKMTDGYEKLYEKILNQEYIPESYISMDKFSTNGYNLSGNH